MLVQDLLILWSHCGTGGISGCRKIVWAPLRDGIQNETDLHRGPSTALLNFPTDNARQCSNFRFIAAVDVVGPTIRGQIMMNLHLVWVGPKRMTFVEFYIEPPLK